MRKSKGNFFLNLEKNGNTTYQNLQDTAKAVLRGNFIAIHAYIKKQEKSQLNNLTSHIKEIEKEKQIKPKVSRRKHKTKRVEINELKVKKTIERINKTKSSFLNIKLIKFYLIFLKKKRELK